MLIIWIIKKVTTTTDTLDKKIVTSTVDNLDNKKVLTTGYGTLKMC